MAADDDGVYMHPIPRIKKVPNIFKANTKRVIIPCVNDTLPSTSNSALTANTKPTVCTHNVLGQPLSDAQRLSVGVEMKNSRYSSHLTLNIRTMMDPICTTRTAGIENDNQRWWQHLENKCPPTMPHHTVDTTIRNDYQYRGEVGPINTRFAATPKKTPAIGIAPVNFLRDPDGKQRFWKEEFSFDHHYDSRRNPPIKPKGRREGNLVWSQYEPAEVDRMLSHYGYSNNMTPSTDHCNAACKQQPLACPQDWTASAVHQRGPAYRPPPVASADACRSRTTSADYGSIPVAL